MQWLSGIVVIVATLMATPALAVSCEEVFTSPVAMRNNGRMLFLQWLSRVYGSDGGQLDVRRIQQDYYNGSCPLASDSSNNCVTSFAWPRAGDNVSIQTKAGTNLSVEYQQRAIIGESNNSYDISLNSDAVDLLSVASEAQVYFSANRNPYYFREIILGYRSELHLKPGTYWVAGKLELGTQSKILVDGEGSVKLFVGGDIIVQHQAMINYQANSSDEYNPELAQPEDPRRFALYTAGKLQTGSNKVRIAAISYAKTEAILDYQTRLDGALYSQQGDVALRNEAEVHGIAEPWKVDFSPLCDGTPPLPEEELNLQFGATGDGQRSGSVSFDSSYQSTPLIFLMTPIDPNNPNADGPVNAEVTAVTSTGFSWERKEPPGNNTNSTTLGAIDWIAINQGEHNLPDGRTLLAGTVEVNTAVRFHPSSQAYVSIDVPSDHNVLLSQRQLDANNCWFSALSNSSKDSLSLEPSEVYRRTGNHYRCQPSDTRHDSLQTERVAYLSTTSGSGVLSNDPLIYYDFGTGETHPQSGRTLNPAQTCQYTSSYSSADLFAVPPVMVASKNSRKGNNGGWMRRCQHTADYFSMVTEEDQYQNSERDHVPEDFSYMAFSSSEVVQVPGLEISTPAIGLTCEAVEVSIRATLDGQLNQSYLGTVTVSTNSNTGTWSAIDANGSLGPSSNGSATYQFVSGDQGEVILGLFHELEGEVTVTVQDGGVQAQTNIDFRAYGLKGELQGGLANDPSNGTNPHIANQNFELVLTAVGKDESQPGCFPIANYQDQKTISFWSEYKTPATGTRQASVKGSTIGNNEGSRSPISVTFTAGISEALELNYPDVGQLDLFYWDEVGTVVDGNTQTLRGSVQADLLPDRLAWRRLYQDQDGVEVLNPGGTANPVTSATRFVPAGSEFDSVLVAMMANCADVQDDACVTPNFTPNANAIEFEHSLHTPQNANPGELAGGSGGAWQNGTADYLGFTWSEVGSINLQAHLLNYLGYITYSDPDSPDPNYIGHDPSASSVVGRFYPDYYALVNPLIEPACTSFTYSGQQQQKLSWTLEAHKQGGGVVTNYHYSSNSTEGFDVAPVASSIDDWSVTLQGSGNSLSNRWLADLLESTGSRWKLGRFELPDSSNTSDLPIDTGFIKELDPEEPISDAEIFLHFKDKDDSLLNCDGGSCSMGVAPEIRHGRVRHQFAYGSELQPITVFSVAEFFEGGSYQQNTADTCSDMSGLLRFAPAKDSSTAIVGAGESSVNLVNPVAAQGAWQVDFSAPGQDNTGSVNYWFELSNSNAGWLIDDNNANAVFDADDGAAVCRDLETDNAVVETVCDSQAGAGQVSFGIFRQSERVIYRRGLY